MNDDKFNEDDLLRRYLLGELGDEEVDRLEKRFLQDDDLFEAMEAVEGDLFAACARGELDPGERERVLHRLASSPGGRDRFALIQGLTRIAAEQSAPLVKPKPVIVHFPPPAPSTGRRSSVLRWLPLAASLLVAVGGGSWLVTEMWSEEPRPLPDSPSVRLAEVLPKLAGPPEKAYEFGDVPPPPPPPPRVPPSLITATLQLALTALRDEEIPQLEIPRKAERVELQVDLGGDEHASYNVSLLNLTTGDGTWEKSGVPPQTLGGRTALLLDVPAESFPDEGDYQLTVDGLTSDGQLEFAGAPEFAIVRAVS